MLDVGPRWTPAVPCSCGQNHHPGAKYYVSVIETPSLGAKSPCVLALGPFLTHPEALAWVDRVNDVVQARWNPHGSAHWYGFGTVAMAADYTIPGKLNHEFFEGRGEIRKGVIA